MSACFGQRHAGAHTLALGLVAGTGNHAGADRHRPAAQPRIVALLDRREESVHVQMDNSPGRGRLQHDVIPLTCPLLGREDRTDNILMYMSECSGCQPEVMPGYSPVARRFCRLVAFGTPFALSIL